LKDNQPRATRLGRTIRKPARLIEELGAGTSVDYKIKLIAAEDDHYYETMKELHELEFTSREIGFVGARI
jgi:hypothetical protein